MAHPPNLDDLAEKRILITGASGFLGKLLSARLGALGAEVHGVSRADRRNEPGPVRWWRADLVNHDEVVRLFAAVEPDIVYHLSGAVNGAPRFDLLLPTYHSLLTTTVNLLGVVKERKCPRLILAGSLEEEVPKDGGEGPISPYAAAKGAAHEYARMCHRLFDVPVVTLRTFMSYGPGQPDWKVIPSTIRALLDGVPPVLSSGRRELDWIFVDDVVEAFVGAAAAPSIEGVTLDIGTGRLASIREVVERIVHLLHSDVNPRYGELPDRAFRRGRAADVTLARRHLGWQARVPLDEGLRRTIGALRVAPGGNRE